MNTIHKSVSVISVLALLMLTTVAPALAFDGRGGDNIVIKAGEVIEDDLYVGANTFVLEGTIKGDLIVFAQSITVNGTVEGDLIAAGQAVVINGTVLDDARIAGAGLQLGSGASIGGDLVAGGASLEAKSGSEVDGELVVGAGQALLSGDVAKDVLVGTSALELRGAFGGDMQAYVDVREGTQSNPPMNMYMTNMPISLPSVQPGFTIADDARIAGDLTYTSTMDLPFPSQAIVGKVTRVEPVTGPEAVRPLPPTPAEKAVTWSLDVFRTIITLILFGLLLGWFLPSFMKNLMDKLQAQPAASLGWGVVAYAAFFFALLLTVVGMIIGGVVFGFLTLGGITATIIWVGILAIFELIIGFVLITAFLTKILVGWLSGKWIIARINPALAEHRVWPLVLGVAIVALVIALPFVGWLFGLIVMFLGLGALWIWGRDLWHTRKTA